MSKIKIISDSSCDLPTNIIDQMGVTIVPYPIFFGEEEFVDYYELTPDVFKAAYARTGIIPRTSLPTPDAIIEYFKRFEEEYDELLFVLISSNGSGTYNASRIAKEHYEEQGGKLKVTLFDTLQASSGIGYFVMKSAEMVEAGKSVEQVIEKLTELRPNFATYIAIQNLEFLRQGGRVSAVGALVGGLLQIRPLVTSFEGTGTIYAKIRGTKKICGSLVDLFREQHIEDMVQISHSDNSEAAAELVKMFKAEFPQVKTIVNEVGASLFTHAGPGAVSIHFLRKDKHCLV